MLALRFVATDGSLESGIDGGGLFKEFMMLGRIKAVTPGVGLRGACEAESAAWLQINLQIASSYRSCVLCDIHQHRGSL